jgi:hypothetical protein
MTNRFITETIFYNGKIYRMYNEKSWPFSLTEILLNENVTNEDLVHTDIIHAFKIIEYYIANLYDPNSNMIKYSDKKDKFIQKFLAKIKKVNIDILYMLLTSNSKVVRNLVRGYL